MSIRRNLSLLLVWILSACSVYPDIPVPTIQVEDGNRLSQAEGITAPMQTAWNWDEHRWFTAELDHRCRGPIRFVDKKNGIDSYVGNEAVPNIIFASDDADVVLGTLHGYYPQLIFSTDGGRHFVQEVRGLPNGPTLKFIIVKRGHLYVGMHLHEREADGYFKWQQPEHRSRWVTEPAAVEEHQLVILEALIDKAQGRIGRYKVLAPTNYKFRSKYSDEREIKRIDNIETIGLPHASGAAPSDACGRAIALPPWVVMDGEKGALELNAWYEVMKAAYPAWAGPDIESFMASHRKRYPGVFKTDTTSPSNKSGCVYDAYQAHQNIGADCQAEREGR